MKRILIIRTDRIGDVVLSTPVITALRQASPDAYIAFMVRPYARDIVDGNPNLDEVILYDKYGVHKGFFSTLSFARDIRKKSFDTAIILHPTNRAHIITFAAGIPERIGWSGKLSFLLTRALKDEKFLGKKHEFEYTLDILKAIGVEAREKGLFVPVKEMSRASVDAKLSERGIGASKEILAVHPGASCRSKRWPLERFASLIEILRGRYDLETVLVAGPGDAAYTSALKESLKGKATDLSGETTVGELAALLERSKLFISNDSGPVHIATAVGAPSIVIFGRKQPGLGPKRWGPTGKGDIIFHKDAGCEICLAHNCEQGFRCLKAITVEDVLVEVEKLLQKITNNKHDEGRKDTRSQGHQVTRSPG
ncbi:MAG: lipopolysaccharide heptosyltransferase II [Candidatus Omnitrophica bacterium]|nr:lipopolysaccharide heptosyltransferase II [Candidatus Omnitrophota bacterium]